MIDDKLNKQGFLDNGIFINKSGAHMLSDGKIAFSTEYGLSDVPSVSFDESYSLCYEGEKGNINLVVGRKKCEWIPCSEQMPPEPNANNTFDKKPVYLVSVKGEDYPHRALWNGRYFMDGFLMLEAVAWMPLPEPYKEE